MDLTLRSTPGFGGRPGPLLIVVMDGVGVGRGDEGDAVALARTPTLDRLEATCPYTQLRAHGTAVGLPSDEDMGNSEVGHNALGAGRVFDQGAKLVNRAIESGALFAAPGWQTLVRNCREQQSALHFIGLLSDGNVHSHIDQLAALLRRAAQEGLERVYVHPLLDGRDVPETSGLVYVDQLGSTSTRCSTVATCPRPPASSTSTSSSGCSPNCAPRGRAAASRSPPAAAAWS